MEVWLAAKLGIAGAKKYFRPRGFSIVGASVPVATRGSDAFDK